MSAVFGMKIRKDIRAQVESLRVSKSAVLKRGNGNAGESVYRLMDHEAGQEIQLGPEDLARLMSACVQMEEEYGDGTE